MSRTWEFSAYQQATIYKTVIVQAGTLEDAEDIYFDGGGEVTMEYTKNRDSGYDVREVQKENIT